MRRLVAVLMMLTFFSLCGCQKQENQLQTALDFRTELLSSKGCSFACDVEADYGDKVYSFSLDTKFDGKDAEITVTAPENIAGITARIDGEDAVLEFDGARLEYGKLANGYVAPLVCPWLLPKAWAEDYISASGADGDMTRITWLRGYNDSEVTIDTWFSQDKPTYAELSYDGSRVLSVTIRDFSFLR